MPKKNIRKLTAEDHKRFEETSRMVRERIAYHEHKAREQQQARRRHGDR